MGCFLTIDHRLKSIEYKTIMKLDIKRLFNVSSIRVQYKTYSTRYDSSSSTILALMGYFLTIDYCLRFKFKNIIRLDIKES